MPQLEDINVRVTVGGVDDEGNSTQRPLEEWGVHRMKGKKKISAYIESETGKSFQVSIQPKIPYPSKGVAAHEYYTRERARARIQGLETEKPGFFKMEDQWRDEDGVVYKPENRELRRSSNPEFGKKSTEIKTERQDEFMSISSLIPSTERMINRTPPPPFHFLATLFLDGRTKPERSAIVYLDPADEDYRYPSGEVVLTGRWAQGQDGSIKEQAWVFENVGIETIFDKMVINRDIDIAAPIPKRDEDALMRAMNSTSIDADQDVESEEKSKVGQMVLIIERVKLGQKNVNPNFCAKHNENEVGDVDMTDAEKYITHTTGLRHNKTIAAHPVRVVAYTPYKPDEDSFATFQFFYRNKETLAKFSFPGFQAGTLRRKTQRNMDTAVEFLTPLSIASSSSARASSGKGEHISFEDQVKKRLSKEAAPPLLKLDSTYRQQGKRVEDENLASLQHNKTKSSDLPLSSTPTVPTPYIRDKGIVMEKQARHNSCISSDKGIDSAHSSTTIEFDKLCPSDTHPSTDVLRSGPVNQNTPFPGSVEDATIDAEKSATMIGQTTPHSSAFIASTIRSDRSIASDADDERELSDGETEIAGLLTGIGQLVLGKRERPLDDAEEQNDGANNTERRFVLVNLAGREDKRVKVANEQSDGAPNTERSLILYNSAGRKKRKVAEEQNDDATNAERRLVLDIPARRGKKRVKAD